MKLLFDAAHATGVSFCQRMIGGFGNAEVLSFHATKVFTTFEGGALVCHDKKMKQRIDYLLDLMDLKNKAKERVERLSSGMKQKLSIARTLIHDPPILLIDEPTLGLDPYFARFVRDFIRNELHHKLNKKIHFSKLSKK